MPVMALTQLHINKIYSECTPNTAQPVSIHAKVCRKYTMRITYDTNPLQDDNEFVRQIPDLVCQILNDKIQYCAVYTIINEYYDMSK